MNIRYAEKMLQNMEHQVALCGYVNGYDHQWLHVYLSRAYYELDKRTFNQLHDELIERERRVLESQDPMFKDPEYYI